MRDVYGLLVKENGDGGDTAFDTGLYYSCCAYLYGKQFAAQETELALIYLRQGFIPKHSPGFDFYCRNPKPDVWWSWVSSMSRDQSVSLQCLMTTIGYTTMHKRMLKGRSVLGTVLLHTNTEEEDRTKKFPDVVSPFELSLWIRNLNLWYLRPLLPLLDLDLAVELLLIRKNKLWDTDAALINKLIATESKWPTIISRYIKRKYANYNVEERINEYYNSDNVGHRLPELAELAILAWKKLIRS